MHPYICNTYVSIFCHQWAWFLSVLLLDPHNHIRDIDALQEIERSWSRNVDSAHTVCVQENPMYTHVDDPKVIPDGHLPDCLLPPYQGLVILFLAGWQRKSNTHWVTFGQSFWVTLFLARWQRKTPALFGPLFGCCRGFLGCGWEESRVITKPSLGFDPVLVSGWTLVCPHGSYSLRHPSLRDPKTLCPIT